MGEGQRWVAAGRKQCLQQEKSISPCPWSAESRGSKLMVIVLISIMS